MTGISLPEFNYASHQIAEARRELRRVEKLLETNENDSGDRSWRAFLDAQGIIRDCQFCIEVSTKAMFKLVGINPPRTHELDFADNRVEGFLRNIPDNCNDPDLVPRVIFLANFWSKFYTESKYGEPELNLTPIDLVRGKDAERAVEDANFCLRMAEKLQAAVQIHLEEDTEIEYWDGFVE